MLRGGVRKCQEGSGLEVWRWLRGAARPGAVLDRAGAWAYRRVVMLRFATIGLSVGGWVLGLVLSGPMGCGPGMADTDTEGDEGETTAATGVNEQCGQVPVPTFGYGERVCGGLGFSQARVWIGGLAVARPAEQAEGFLYSVTDWQPTSQGATVEFALDGRSFSPRFVVSGPIRSLLGVHGTITGSFNGELRVVSEATANDGILEFALTEFGLGIPYTLVLEGWPLSTCEVLRIDLPC